MATELPPEPTGQADESLASMLPLAASLHDAVQARLSADATGHPTSLDRVFDEAFTEVAGSMIVARLNTLSTSEFIALYARIKGDEALLTKLNELAAIKQAQFDRELRLARIAQDARVSSALHLGRLVAGETIVVGLFDAARPDLAARRFANDQSHRSLHRTIAARLLDPTDGRMEVLRDTWSGPVWAKTQPNPIAPHTHSLIGTAVTTADGPVFEPTISLHTPLSYQPANSAEPITTPQIVGYVETVDGSVLLDAAK